VPFLAAIHGRSPRVLGEDFCGSAANSRAWVKLVESGTAIAVDLDAEALSRARSERITAIQGDVRSATSAALHPADVIYAGNFSIGELHSRSALLDYLRHARARLKPNGVFVCDTYGGASAFRIGAVERSRFTPGGMRIRCTWEQRRADPLMARVENALHFRVERNGDIVQEITDAFVYRWRLWSVPEIRDALEEAAFTGVEARLDLSGAETESKPFLAAERDRSVNDPQRFVACVFGRTHSPETPRAASGR
jgi:SAM-dependent methyltransferase